MLLHASKCVNPGVRGVESDGAKRRQVWFWNRGVGSRVEPLSPSASLAHLGGGGGGGVEEEEENS